MGAQQFQQDGEDKTVDEAFRNAKDQALYDYGHWGYTGSLAEKPGYVEFVLPEGVGVSEAVRVLAEIWLGEERPSWLSDEIAETYEDKWGDAVAIRTGETSWTFVGWASS